MPPFQEAFLGLHHSKSNTQCSLQLSRLESDITRFVLQLLVTYHMPTTQGHQLTKSENDASSRESNPTLEKRVWSAASAFVKIRRGTRNGGSPKGTLCGQRNSWISTCIHVLGQKLLDEIKPKPTLTDSINNIYQNQHRRTIAHT